MTAVDPLRPPVVVVAPAQVAPPEPPGPMRPSRYAGLATRVLAFAADVAVINVVGWFTALVVGLCVSFFDLPSGIKDVLIAIGSLIALLWGIGYFVFFWSTTGQTPGNRLLGIRVIDARTLAPPRPRRALRRFFWLILAALPVCLGILWILVDDRRRGWHDKLARTVVADVTDEPPPIRSDVRPHGRRLAR
jgi:uncharacterized RDD family membrane protein YckC